MGHATDRRRLCEEQGRAREMGRDEEEDPGEKRTQGGIVFRCPVSGSDHEREGKE